MSYLQSIFYQLCCRNANQWYVTALHCDDRAERASIQAEAFKWYDYANEVESMDANVYAELVKAYASEYIAVYNELAVAYPEVLR